MKYIYIKSEAAMWTVGFYDPAGKWQPESDHSSAEAAAARVHYLNGGASRQASDVERYRQLRDWLLAKGILRFIEVPRSDSDPFVMERLLAQEGAEADFYGETFEDALATLPNSRRPV